MNHGVVIIEDEPAVLELLQDILEVAGYSVIAVERPDLLVAALAGQAPHLFLIDLMLPGMDGIDLARTLRSGGFAGTPMIAMSASPPTLRRAVATGLFQAALPKPFDLSTLLASIGQQLAENAVAS